MIDRRKFLTISGMTGALYAIPPVNMMADYSRNKDDIFHQSFAKLNDSLSELLKESMVTFQYHRHKLYLHSSSVSTTYRGIWPDDFLYPMLCETSHV